ncbi:MAG: UDP-N-acetylmuramyl-tripeptide synthetase [Betaproteobacteria bacterium]|nr:UDP-N-acetylmuramyl-tripeptide synthetase [Betaproteobacteria bacterium]
MGAASISQVKIIHPLAVEDDEASALGERLRKLGSAGHLYSDTRRCGPLDWAMLRTGASMGLEALLNRAQEKRPRGLVVDAVDEPAAMEWLNSRDREGWVPEIVSIEGLKQRAGIIASVFYGDPSAELEVIAVTGTNGKSTVVHALASGLSVLGQVSASVGTLGVQYFPVGGDSPVALLGSGLTSLDPVHLQEVLASLRDRGVTVVCLEASSIGLVEHRLTGCRIRWVGITNLSRDHLDFHRTMESYAEAKALLLQAPNLKGCVASTALHYSPLKEASILSTAARKSGLLSWADARPPDETRPLADTSVLRLRSVAASSVGTEVELRLAQVDGKVEIQLPVWGQHNLENASLVAGLLERMGHPASSLARVLRAMRLPEGRLERVSPGDSKQPAPWVFVDYAHTPEALERVLEALQPLARSRGGQLVTVFGCGGDRDPGKRGPMGEVVSRGADRVFVTSDNPRSEDPATIIQAVVAGLSTEARARCRLMTDRAEAIDRAIESAGPQDVILIAGKGHEKTQQIGDRLLAFDDRLVAAEAICDWQIPAGLDLLLEIPDSKPSDKLHCLGPGTAIEGFSSDSRSVGPGEVFIALVGERFDGHDHVAKAFERGAVAAVVSRLPEGLDPARCKACVLVPDTQRALLQLGALWRARWSGCLVAIAGSNGKTTAKEMLCALFRSAVGARSTWGTPGNLNNAIGLPLTLLGLRHRHRFAAVEIGMNHPGEVAALAQAASPNHALITNAQREHQEFMSSVRACAEENGTILQYLRQNATAVIPCDPEHEPIWTAQAKGAITGRFGLVSDSFDFNHRPHLEVKAKVVGVAPLRATLCLETNVGATDDIGPIEVPAVGIHFARHMAAIGCLARLMKFSDQVIETGLSMFRPVAGRGHLIEMRPGLLVVDDSYNANPDSVLAAIDALAAVPPPKALVLGDMGEVGSQGPQFHREVLEATEQKGIDAIYVLGDAFAQAALETGRAKAFSDIDGLCDAVSDWVDDHQPPSTLWVKGSRFMRMERVIHSLKERPARNAPVSA